MGGGLTKIVGIINLTPDSFSDGGAFVDEHAVVDACVQMLRDGADLIDIGAESTRPGATPISPKEEWARLAPSLLLLAKDALFINKISIDTRHAEVAQRALDLGISYINDVSSGTDKKMLSAVVAAKAKYIFMHSLTIPADPFVVLPLGIDVVDTLLQFAQNKIAEFLDMGIKKEHLVFDPGIGFNKDSAQSLEILKRISEFEALGIPRMVGHSRKSFLKNFTESPPKDRDFLTLVTSAFMASKQVEYLRVHNVGEHFEALKLWQALN